MPQNGFHRFVSRSRRRKRLRRSLRTPSSAMPHFQEGSRLEPKLLKDSTGIRHELVARVRQEIHAGIYDTPAKFDAALERMFEHLAWD